MLRPDLRESGRMISTSAKPNDYQVVVVGFGPTGAVATSLLGKRGIRTLAIDRLRNVYDSRAPSRWITKFFVCWIISVIATASSACRAVSRLAAFRRGRPLIRRIDMVPNPIRWDTRQPWCSEPPVEAVLRENAASYASVTVELGTEFVGLAQSDTGVGLDCLATTAASVTADYVIACDGASSEVRGQVGLALEDLVFDEPWLIIDVLVNEEALGKLPQTAAEYCDPARPTTFIMGLATIGAGKSCCCLAKIRRRRRNRNGPGSSSRNGSRRTKRHCGGRPATVFTRWSPRNGGAAASSSPATRRISSLPSSGRACARVCATARSRLETRSRPSWALWRSPADSYGEERGDHVRELTTRIKAIGQVICERDPQAARERDRRILAEGGGEARTITVRKSFRP